MRYIKKYKKSSLIVVSENHKDESDESKPEVGDYVICDENTNDWRLRKLEIFLANNIGRIASKGNLYYSVYYPNFRDDLDIIDFFSNPTPGYREMLRSEIKYFAKTKEELEMKMDMDKYNL